MAFFQISPNFYFFFDYFDPESKLAIFYKIPKNMTLFHINIYKYEESWSERWLEKAGQIFFYLKALILSFNLYNNLNF